MTSAADVAAWMKSQVDETGFLDQESAVYRIQSDFGSEFTYINGAGNLAISKDVLAAFKKVSSDTVVWERGTRMWRKRADHDTGGRQQD